MIRTLLTAAFVMIAALPALAAVKIQEVTSPGGIRAWLVEEHSLPFTALELRFEGGTSLDVPGKRGATTLMTSTLEEGAGDLNSQQFAAAREDLAAEISFDAGDDAVTVSAKMLTENQDQVVALLKSALTEPRFDQDAIDRVRSQIELDHSSRPNRSGQYRKRYVRPSRLWRSSLWIFAIRHAGKPCGTDT